MSEELFYSGGAGVEDGEEFDEAATVTKYFCEPISVEQFEDEAEAETQKALCDLMNYLDDHKDEFTEHLKKKKRQDLENGGVVSFLKVKVMDVIHGTNSPLLRVSEKERDKSLEHLKYNMLKAFDVAQETKGRRVSKRLEEKRRKKSQGKTSTKSPHVDMPPPPPPPPPPPVPQDFPTPKLKVEARKPFTPIENRLKEMKTPVSIKKGTNLDDTFGATPRLDCSLTSLHQELLSSNPWQRLKCVENRSPGGTPVTNRVVQTPSDPLHVALINKFRNMRSPSPTNTTVTSADFTP